MIFTGREGWGCQKIGSHRFDVAFEGLSRAYKPVVAIIRKKPHQNRSPFEKVIRSTSVFIGP